MEHLRSPDALARRLASRQRALLTREQARSCGLSDDQVDHRLATGEWIRKARGVFAIAGAGRSWQQDLLVAVLAGPPGSVAGLLSAAALHGLWRPPPLPQLLAPPGTSARQPLALVRRCALPPEDRTVVDGIPSTTVSRTLADASTLLGREPLAELVDDAMCRSLASVESVVASMERAGRRRGRALLMEVLGAWTPGVQPGSPAELRALRLLEQWGFGRPVLQHEVRDAAGRFVGRLDLAYPERLVGIEYASVRWHGPRRWEHDEQRAEGLRRAGWQVLELDKADLVPGERRFRDELERALRRSPRGEPHQTWPSARRTA